MDHSRMIFAIIGFSASFFFCIRNLKIWQKQQIAAERLKLVSEALDFAEQRVARFQERHDRMLSQACSYYLANAELLDALAGARAAMNDALEFAVDLRMVQMKMISNFPNETDITEFDKVNANRRSLRTNK